MGCTICIIIVRPPGKHLNRTELKEAFRINSDGAGLMYNDGDEIHIMKGWFGFRKFYKSFRALELKFPRSTFVIHMRIGTSGERNKANCHPFQVNKRVGFAHNGIMHSLGNKVRSDTKEFVEDVLCKLPDGWWDNKDVLAALSRCAVASGSKFVLLVGTGSYTIINASLGHWKSGCWYSNYSYVVVPKTTTGNMPWEDGHWDSELRAWVPNNVHTSKGHHGKST